MSTRKQCSLAPSFYPPRAEVSDEQNWSDSKYKPIEFTTLFILSEPRPLWADPCHVPLEQLHERVTYTGGDLQPLADVCFFDNTYNRYLNPCGKTGITGRGSLGKWGANFAADVLVTWESNNKCMVLLVSKNVGDSCNLAFPAGMVEPGSTVPDTLRAELTEEAVKDSDIVSRLFADCMVSVVYRGFVDDFRNTDNAWMETTAVHYHATGEIGKGLQLAIADTKEIKSVAWHNIDSVTEMYASHLDWLNTLKSWWHHTT